MEKFKFEEYLPAGKGTLRFTSDVGTTIIEAHDGEQLLVEGEGEHITPTLTREGNIVTVQIKASRGLLLLRRPKTAVHIYVPKACHVDAKTITGQQTIRNLSSPLTARVVTGDQRIENVAAPINAKTVTGQLIYKGTLTAENHTFSTVTGRLKLALSETPNAIVDAKTTTGDIQSDFELEMAVQRKNIIGARLKGAIGKGTGHIRARVTTGSFQLVSA